MLLQEEREQIVFYGRKLISSKLTTGSGGNLSIINRQENFNCDKTYRRRLFDHAPGRCRGTQSGR